jgi:hypothetical protein
MKFIIFLLSLNLLATTYSIKDLEILVTEKSYQEALAHLKDISPSQRNDQWRKIAITVIEKSFSQIENCEEKWFFHLEMTKAYPFLLELKSWPQLKSEAGICLLKANKFYDHQSREQLVDELLLLQPELIEKMIKEANYHDPKRRFLFYLAKKPESFKNNPTVINYLKRISEEKLLSDTDEINKLKMKMSKIFGVNNQLKLEAEKRLSALVADMMNGDFSRSSFKDYYYLEESNQLKNDLRAQFCIVQFVVATNTHEKMLPCINKLKRQEKLDAQKRMIAIKPKKSFWFSGGGWDERKVIELIKNQLPVLLEFSQKSCQKIDKDSLDTESGHLSSYACKFIVGMK